MRARYPDPVLHTISTMGSVWRWRGGRMEDAWRTRGDRYPAAGRGHPGDSVPPVEAIVRSSSIRLPSRPPSALAAEVVRNRLVSLLDARFDRKVTTIVAGAGFGKTTLLAQAMRSNLAAPLGIDGWVSCQPDDQDPACFAVACCRAAGVEPAGPVRRSADVLAAMRDMSPIDVCLLIDDVHELMGSDSEVLLAEVVRRLPENGHLLLSGRERVEVPLARLRASGRCLELDQRQLAFTPDEEQELAHLLEVAPLGSGLAGWPASDLPGLDLTPSRRLRVPLGRGRRGPAADPAAGPTGSGARRLGG